MSARKNVSRVLNAAVILFWYVFFRFS